MKIKSSITHPCVVLMRMPFFIFQTTKGDKKKSLACAFHLIEVYGDQHQAFKKDAKVSQSGHMRRVKYSKCSVGIRYGLVRNKLKFNILCNE